MKSGLLYVLFFAILIPNLAYALKTDAYITAAGDVIYKEDNGYSIEVMRDGRVFIDNQLYLTCDSIKEIRRGGVHIDCMSTNNIEVSDGKGNIIDIFGSMVDIKSRHGDTYDLRRNKPSNKTRKYAGGNSDIGISSGGVNMNFAGMSIRMGPDGFSINEPGSSVNVGDSGVNITDSTGNVSVNNAGVNIEEWRNYKNPQNQVDITQAMQSLNVVKVQGGYRVDLAGDILFDFNKTQIKPDAYSTLSSIAEVIRRKSNGEVLIEGHTDSVGRNDYNNRLSKSRAESVVRWLNTQERIPNRILQAYAFGESRPRAENKNLDGSDNPEGRALNRRVEIYIASED